MDASETEEKRKCRSTNENGGLGALLSDRINNSKIEHPIDIDGYVIFGNGGLIGDWYRFLCRRPGMWCAFVYNTCLFVRGEGKKSANILSEIRTPTLLLLPPLMSARRKCGQREGS